MQKIQSKKILSQYSTIESVVHFLGFRENAIKVLCDLENMHPEVVSIPMMKYGIYRRMWSLSKAGEAIQTARNNVQSRDNYVYLTMKLARFRAKVEGNFNAAYEVLQEALKKYPVRVEATCLLICLFIFQLLCSNFVGFTFATKF